MFEAFTKNCLLYPVMENIESNLLEVTCLERTLFSPGTQWFSINVVPLTWSEEIWIFWKTGYFLVLSV